MTGRTTIFALASGSGRVGIAVFRVSGPLAATAYEALSGKSLPEPRRATRVRLRQGEDVIDDGLALWFPGPHSFTGEDVVEFHVHGGKSVAAALCDAFLTLNLQPAEAGAFTRRAFESGKLDLTRVEGLADLIAAETASQRRQALRQMEGGLMRLYDGWRERLLRLQAHMEAEIDFAEEDVPEDLARAALAAVGTLRDEISGHLSDSKKGERLRDGLSVAILGAPNVGKSSLLNRIAGRPAAIVSTIAGTTRDIIEVHLDLGGYPVLLADTAGLREAADAVESEGIRRAHARAETADLRLVVFDATECRRPDPTSRSLLNTQSLVVWNKVDQVQGEPPRQLAERPAFAVSAETGAGIEGLLAAMTTWAERELGSGEGPVLTRVRHRAALQDVSAALARAGAAALPELAAEDVRVAQAALGRITGRVDVEDMLDVIFREFCIGK